MIKKITVVALASVVVPLMATAGLVSTNYGDRVGLDVTFYNIEEHTSTPGDTVPKYGTPTAVGNSLDFNPVGFEASVVDGGFDYTDGNLVFGVQAHQDRIIDTIRFSESGSYFLPGTATDPYVEVNATFVINVYEVDGVDLLAPLTKTVNMTFNPTNSLSPPDYSGFGNWSGSVDVDINQIMDDVSQAYSFGATEVTVDLNNILYATSTAGTALIAKKDFNSAPGMRIEIIPEPASMAMFSFIGVSCLFVRRFFS